MEIEQFFRGTGYTLWEATLLKMFFLLSEQGSILNGKNFLPLALETYFCLLEKTPFQSGFLCTGKQTGSQKSYSFALKRRQIYQVYLVSLTLKAPRKSASENVVCLCRLLHLLANFSNLHFAYRQTVWTQIRLLLKEQSDLDPHCLQQ